MHRPKGALNRGCGITFLFSSGGLVRSKIAVRFILGVNSNVSPSERSSKVISFRYWSGLSPITYPPGADHFADQLKSSLIHGQPDKSSKELSRTRINGNNHNDIDRD